MCSLPYWKIEILVIFRLLSCYGNRVKWARHPILYKRIKWSVLFTLVYKRHENPQVCNSGIRLWVSPGGKNANFDHFCIQFGVQISKIFLKFFLVAWHMVIPLLQTNKPGTWGFCQSSWAEGHLLQPTPHQNLTIFDSWVSMVTRQSPATTEVKIICSIGVIYLGTTPICLSCLVDLSFECMERHEGH